MNLPKDRFYDLAKDALKKLTLDEKLGLLSTHQHRTESIGLDEFFIGHEVARGFVGRGEDQYSTVFPQPVGLAGTFDTELMEEIGEIAGNECRAYYNKDKKGALCVWGPTVDMERDPRWGRTEEAYGEDVFLAGQMTAAYTRTMAGEKDGYYKTIPTLKHFCANNNEHHRGSCNAYLPTRLKYEYYYAAFMNAVKYGGARSVMTAYNEINGIPGLCNPELDTILKGQWGLWFAVTDGGDFGQNVAFHRFCEKHSETYADAVKAGCDIMTDVDSLVRRSAQKALESGLITESDIDRSLMGVLYARARLGHLEGGSPFDGIKMDIVDCDSSRQVNLRAAREQVVLLKNDGILPLKDVKGKLAVCGPTADESLKDWYTGVYRDAVSVKAGIEKEFPDHEVIFDTLWDVVAVKCPNGKYLSAKEDGTIAADADEIGESEKFELQDWGENWINLFSVKYRRYVRNTDGKLMLHNRTIYDWFTHETFNFRSVPEGTLIEEFLGHQRLTLDENDGLGFSHRRAVKSDQLWEIVTLSSGRERADKIAESCGTVIYCTGNYPVQVAKECYDRKTLALNVQPGMAEHLHSVNPRTVMVIVSSYQYSAVRENELLPAIVYTTHAGAFLGTAVAETLSGRSNPSGRLSMTWYKSENDLPDIMDYDIASAGTTYMYFTGTPLYPFGYGLSYSEFAYSGLTVRESGEGLTAELTVENTSGTDGDEVVQIYFAAKSSAAERPLKKLCGFGRVSLKAGEKKQVTINIPHHILEIYDVRRRRMILEEGRYELMAGSSSADIRLSTELELSGERLALRESIFDAVDFDIADSVSIQYSRRLRRQYVRAAGWTGKAVYRDVVYAGNRTLTLDISSVMQDEKVTVKAAGTELTIEAKASDSFDDFRSYNAELPEGLPETGELTVSLPGSTALLEIRLER